MANPRCQAILNIETVSQAFTNQIFALTTEITNCLYSCFLDDFVTWAGITYDNYPFDVVVDLANQAFSDGTELFCQAAAATGLYDGKAKIKTILFSYCRFQLLAKLRNEDRLKDHQKRWGQLQDKASNDPEQADADEQLYQLLEKALSKMEPKDREIILWRQVDEKGNDEIAALLAITVDSATNRIFRCMERLRKILNNLK